MATPACDQCYRFKVKCSRDPDCCRRCANNRSVCTYSAAAPPGKPETRSKSPEEHRKKKARQGQIDDPSVLSTDLRGTSVDSRSYSFTDSPTSQHAELHVDEMNNFYGNTLTSLVKERLLTILKGFDIPTIETTPYAFNPVSVPPTPTTWVTNAPALYEIDTIGMNNGTDNFSLPWQNPEILHSPFFANGIPLQKFPPTSAPAMNQLPTPTSPAFPRDNIPATTCDCFSSALNVLNELNACVQEQTPLNHPHHHELVSRSLVNVLNTITNALELCEASTQCICAHNSMTSMLYAMILQQISACHEVLSANTACDPRQPSRQKSWIANDRARALNISNEMEMRLRNTFDEIEDQSEIVGRNSVIGLLSTVRTKFSEEIQGLHG
jgi:hypothetical protein